MFLAGHTSAFDELMIRYGDSLTFYLRGYLRTLEDAEDLMIEAFARLMAKKPRIGDGCFKAYLYKTARHLAIRQSGRIMRLRTFSLDGLDAELADEASLEKTFFTEERKRVLYACLDKIDPELKEALWLVYLEDLSYADAASVMGVNAKRIDHLLERGKRDMRKELKKEGVTNAYQ